MRELICCALTVPAFVATVPIMCKDKALDGNHGFQKMFAHVRCRHVDLL